MSIGGRFRAEGLELRGVGKTVLLDRMRDDAEVTQRLGL
jgi:hypothetical protein